MCSIFALCLQLHRYTVTQTFTYKHKHTLFLSFSLSLTIIATVTSVLLFDTVQFRFDMARKVEIVQLQSSNQTLTLAQPLDLDWKPLSPDPLNICMHGLIDLFLNAPLFWTIIVLPLACVSWLSLQHANAWATHCWMTSIRFPGLKWYNCEPSVEHSTALTRAARGGLWPRQLYGLSVYQCWCWAGQGLSWW